MENWAPSTPLSHTAAYASSSYTPNTGQWPAELENQPHWTPTPPPLYTSSYVPEYESPLAFEPRWHPSLWFSTPPAAPSLLPVPPSPPSSEAKRSRPADENSPPGCALPESPVPKKRKKLSVEDKLSIVFDAIYVSAGWKLADFLWHAFQYGRHVHRSQAHAGRIAAFLQGKCNYSPVMIVDLWLKHPDGRISCDEPLYTVKTPYLEIKPVRQALTAFAAQLVARQVTREAEDAVAPEAGFHTARPARQPRDPSKKATTRLVWSDIGAVTIARMQDTMRRHQPLTWELIHAIACRRTTPDKATVTRKRRPLELVIMQAISSLNFSRSNRANLFPIALGLAYFSLSAPFDVYLLNSRLGVMPSYNKIYATLDGLAQHEAEAVKAHGRDPNTVGIIWLDNVQNYLIQRDARIGREDQLNIGIAATYVELPCSPSAMDMEDKRRRVEENRRRDLTVEELVGLVDTAHREVVGSLQWLRVLTHYVPELCSYKAMVSERYRTCGAKQQLPIVASRLHPLATSGRNESVTMELKDALLDFLGQVGQTPDTFKKQLFMIGGDGLTYEKLNQLKMYLQFHDNELDSLELVQPVLALWHTAWADLSRIFGTHWGSNLSEDPSTLGHSAAKIGRRPPPNLKKVDFNYGAELMYLILDARMLDCWRLYYGAPDLFDHFAHLGRMGKLPSFEELEDAAVKLYRAYSTHRAAERAMYSPEPSDGRPEGEWERTVPVGDPWLAAKPTDSQETPKTQNEAAEQGGGRHTVGAEMKKSVETSQQAFRGDQVLADSIAFMKDAWVSREFMYAVAEGDVGRVYEAMKMMLFTFAGSPHTKYTSYLLEFICVLELESSPELRRSILSTLLLNLSGEAGHFSPADLIQEYFNRLLQAIAQRKGVQYEDYFLRNILSRNLYHLSRLQDLLKDGLGLVKRAGKHTSPHQNPELCILLCEYREQALHTRREGRHYGTAPIGNQPSDRDDFRRGLRNLRSGKLSKWIQESTFLRSARIPQQHLKPNFLEPDPSQPEPTSNDQHSANATEEGMGCDEDLDNEDRASFSAQRLPLARVVDGELIFDYLDATADAQVVFAGLDDQDDDEEHVSHEPVTMEDASNGR